MCNEQTTINYHATVENQNEISKLTRDLHDKEMLIDEMYARLERCEARLNRQAREIEQLHRGERKYY